MVVPLQEWLPDETMQTMVQENNLPETAFFIPSHCGFHIRWFTTIEEVKLCGHATLASAFVLFNNLGYENNTITFDSLSGPLSVTRSDELLTLDFPSQEPEKCEIPEELVKGLSKYPLECYKNEDYIAVFGSEEEISSINPNHSHLELLDLRGVIITAPSVEYDFVARFFAPKLGLHEDHVTGSAYTQLMPYWSEKMGRTSLHAKQLSQRGGKLQCELIGSRVLLSGSAVQYMEDILEIKT